MNNKFMISNDTYKIENGNIFDKFKKKIVPMKQLFEQKDFKKIKLAFISIDYFYHAYVLDDIQACTQELEGDFDIEFLFDSIVKLKLSGKCKSITENELIQQYIADPEKYKESYNISLGRFLDMTEDIS